MYLIFYLMILSFVACNRNEPPILNKPTRCKTMDQSGTTCLDGAQVSKKDSASATSGMTDEQFISFLSAIQSRSNQPPVVVAPNDTIEQYTLKSEEYWLSERTRLRQEKTTTTSQTRLQEIDKELIVVETYLNNLRETKKNPPDNWLIKADDYCKRRFGIDHSCFGAVGDGLRFLWGQYKERKNKDD